MSLSTVNHFLRGKIFDKFYATGASPKSTKMTDNNKDRVKAAINDLQQQMHAAHDAVQLLNTTSRARTFPMFTK
jgi:hypothetical protein